MQEFFFSNELNHFCAFKLQETKTGQKFDRFHIEEINYLQKQKIINDTK